MIMVVMGFFIPLFRYVFFSRLGVLYSLVCYQCALCHFNAVLSVFCAVLVFTNPVEVEDETVFVATEAKQNSVSFLLQGMTLEEVFTFVLILFNKLLQLFGFIANNLVVS